MSCIFQYQYYRIIIIIILISFYVWMVPSKKHLFFFLFVGSFFLEFYSSCEFFIEMNELCDMHSQNVAMLCFALLSIGQSNTTYLKTFYIIILYRRAIHCPINNIIYLQTHVVNAIRYNFMNSLHYFVRLHQ